MKRNNYDSLFAASSSNYAALKFFQRCNSSYTNRAQGLVFIPAAAYQPLYFFHSVRVMIAVRSAHNGIRTCEGSCGPAGVPWIPSGRWPRRLDRYQLARHCLLRSCSRRPPRSVGFARTVHLFLELLGYMSALTGIYRASRHSIRLF